MCEVINKKEIKRIYKNQDICFPMIMGVIEGNSEGVVYCDNIQTPRHIFVKNKFGFCQEFFEEFSIDFFSKIVDEIIEDRHRQKLRMYMPTDKMKDYLEGKKDMTKCERVHFKYNRLDTNIIKRGIYTVQRNECCVRGAICDRYYKNEQDFIENAMPVVAYDNNKNEIGIIYSTAKGDGNCEIDIFVEEQYRKQGVGKALVYEFIEICQKQGIIPNWDCYSNNAASMKLAECCGFEPLGSYCFYNVDVFKD